MLIVAMSDFETVFEITRNSNGVFGDEVFRLLIGVVAFLGSLKLLVRNVRRREGAKDYIWPILVLVWSIGWLSMHLLPNTFGHTNKLVSAYHDKRHEVVEGPVEVLHQQPYHGHSEGDRIRVGGKEFVISYFYYTPAYTKTIAHKGVLNQGTYARLYYYDREILRIDIRK
jgi:hypothetical protein